MVVQLKRVRMFSRLLQHPYADDLAQEQSFLAVHPVVDAAHLPAR